MSRNSGGFFDHIEKLFNDPELSDVAIVLDNDEEDGDTSVATKTFHGHRVILATVSDYFRAMLFGSFREASKKEIRLPGVPYSIFMELMRFVYFGWTNPAGKTLKDAVEYFTLARMLLLDSSVEKFFERWMKTQVELWEHDLLKIFALACEWEMYSLGYECCKKINAIANEFLANSSFLELPLEAVEKMLAFGDIGCTRAELEQAIQAWIGHHEEEITDEDADKLTERVASFGELCCSYDLLALYTKEEMQKSEEVLQFVEFLEPTGAVLEAVHEYSYSSDLRAISCIYLRGIKICLRANLQFGPQNGRIKSELELCLKIKGQNADRQRNVTVRYDFTQHEQQLVTIFFKEVACCKNCEISFHFSWNGSGVQPILHNYGPVHSSLSFVTGSSYVIWVIGKDKLSDSDSDGQCFECEMREEDRCSCLNCNFTVEAEEEEEVRSENDDVDEDL